MSEESMKGCPFCVVDHPEDMTLLEDRTDFYVQCDGCLARGPLWDSAKGARTQWNERSGS